MNDKSFYTAKEASTFLNINEKKIYTLAQNGTIPATKVTGKWLFPIKELENFLTEDAKKNFIQQYELKYHDLILIAGSDDPLMNFVCSRYNLNISDNKVFLSSVGSTTGLEMLRDNLCHVAFSHIHNYENNDYNFSLIKNIMGKTENLVVINLFLRKVGFASKKEINSFEEIKSQNLSFINRQINSGIRNLIDHKLQEENIKTSDIDGYQNEVMTHQEVALKVSSDVAEVGICSESAAKQFGLQFNIIEEERFDMIIKKQIFFEKNIQHFLNCMKGTEFSKYVSDFEGYNLQLNGQIIYGE